MNNRTTRSRRNRRQGPNGSLNNVNSAYGRQYETSLIVASTTAGVVSGSVNANALGFDDGDLYKVYKIRAHSCVDSASTPCAVRISFQQEGGAVSVPHVLSPGGKEVVESLRVPPSNDFKTYGSGDAVINYALRTGNANNATATLFFEVWAFSTGNPAAQ